MYFLWFFGVSEISVFSMIWHRFWLFLNPDPNSAWKIIQFYNFKSWFHEIVLLCPGPCGEPPECGEVTFPKAPDSSLHLYKRYIYIYMKTYDIWTINTKNKEKEIYLLAPPPWTHLFINFLALVCMCVLVCLSVCLSVSLCGCADFY